MLTRESNGHFPSSTSSHSFSLYPEHPMSDVRLDLSLQQLGYLIEHIDWSLMSVITADVMSRFFEAAHSRNTHDCVILPYSLALVAVKTLLSISITQFELIENNFESLQEQEILHKFQASAQPG